MAPITDETVDNLRDLVHKLESRVQQLEARLESSGSGSSPKALHGPSIRMILMGPPGAGTNNIHSSILLPSADPKLQVKVHKRQRLERSSAHVIW